jgi:ATP-dependent DNA helicase RecG
MRPSEAKRLLSSGQNPEVAFASEKVTNADLSETLVALANAGGGTILLGVTQTGSVRGVQDADGLRDRVLWAALSITPPLVLPIPEQIAADWGSGENRTLVAAHVPRGLPSVYAAKGRYLVRDGLSNRILAASEIHQLMLRRGGDAAPGRLETQVAPGATLDDLDWDRVRQYANRLERTPSDARPTDVVYPPDAVHPRQTAPEEVLRQRACLVKTDGQYRPTTAGLLLFGHYPSLWTPGAEITAVRYPGTEMGDQFVREDIKGPLPDQIRKAEAFLRANVPQQTVLEGLTHRDRPAYPDQVLREVVVNAVAHRDYAIAGESIQIFIFGDRVRIYSPGRLPGHVTVQNIVDERFSRNPVIVQVLADLGFVERLGYGIDRMMLLLQQAEQPAPLFKETTAGFQVILRTWLQPAAAAAGALPEAVDLARWSHLELNPRQELAIRYIIEHGGPGSARLTNREYQTLCPDVSAETIRRDLSDMVHKGILLRIGRKRATYYILKDAALAST